MSWSVQICVCLKGKKKLENELSTFVPAVGECKMQAVSCHSQASFTIYSSSSETTASCVSAKLWAAFRTTKNFKHIQGYAHVKFKNKKAMERLKYLSQTQCTVHFMTVADPGIHAPYPPLMRTHVKKILA